jgi:predicted nucleic acid-binding protein
MAAIIELKGIVTEDGRLIVELPPEFPAGEVMVRIAPAAEAEDTSAPEESDPDLETLFDEMPINGLGQTVGEIAGAPEIGSWADSPIDRAMRFMRRFHLEHPTPDDNIWAMRQFARVRLSHKSDYPDALIASVAARLDVPLYTLNLRHYTLLLGDRVQRPY